MARRGDMRVFSMAGRERPLFGQAAQEIAGIKNDQLEECLARQRQLGARLGQMLRQAGLLSRNQIQQILTLQAQKTAQALQADVAPLSFPYPTFLSLCMPAYNEAANIEDTLDAACAILPNFVRQFEVVVVDDGCKDDTAGIVEAYSQNEPRVRLVRHPQNRGYGAAVTTGLRAAKGDHIVFTDSDGQFSMLDLPHLLFRLKQSDIVVGYRYYRADPWHRKVNAWCWGKAIRLLLGVKVRDLDCAFKLFPRQVIDRLQLTATGAAINAEILTQCVRAGLTISQTPVNHFPRYQGVPTGAAFKVILRAFRELPRLFKYRFGSGPLPRIATGTGSDPLLKLHETAANAAPPKSNVRQPS